MPRSTKNSVCVVNTSVCQDTLTVLQESSSSDVEIEVQSPLFIQPSTSQPQPFVQPMFMPYIQGQKMDQTVNNSLYHRFIKWKLSCENILECELAILPDSEKCKEVIVWSGNFGMDQYVSWCLLPEDLSLDVIWAKFEDFCKPQTNEYKSQIWPIDKLQTRHLWMSGTVLYKARCPLPNTHQNCKYLASRYFLVLLKMVRSLFPKPSTTPTLI